MNSQQGSSQSCLPTMNTTLEYPSTVRASTSQELIGNVDESHGDGKALSAPIELLSEFLSALMLRDYDSALMHCNTILQFEPENQTALEFFPLIQQRLIEVNADDSSSDEDMKSSCSEEESWGASTTSSDEYSTADNSLWSVSTVTNSESIEKDDDETEDLDTSIEEDEHEV